MSHIGEFDLIGRIKAAFGSDARSAAPAGTLGIGDDCAIIPQRSGLDTLVTTDLLIEDRHFLLDDVSPEALGWKSAAVNISDIAAMGGRPAASFLSIALPGKIESEWVERFIDGFRELSSRWNVPLLGGDTSASPDKLFINVTVLGQCPAGKAVLRAGAQAGDIIYVTGPLGDSGTGLRLILEGKGGQGDGKDISALIHRHYHPVPRVDEGILLAATPGVHAMMDISDGIASDLGHILKASAKGATVDLRSLPISTEMRRVCEACGWDAGEIAATGGEDYELLFTAAPGTQLPQEFTAIGRITGGSGIRWEGGAKSDYQGFTHF